MIKIYDYHRLTEKEYDGYKLIKFFPGNTGDLAIYKLGLLEDLLEKYGITYWYELEHLIELAHKYEELKIKVEKELKALEIIKDTCKLKVYKNKLGQCFLEGIDILYAISQEEYDLLKEVLK